MSFITLIIFFLVILSIIKTIVNNRQKGPKGGSTYRQTWQNGRPVDNSTGAETSRTEGSAGGSSDFGNGAAGSTGSDPFARGPFGGGPAGRARKGSGPKMPHGPRNGGKGLKVIIGVAIAAAVVLIVAFDCVFFTNEQQTGFVCTLGKNSMIETAGVHFKAPFIAKKYVYDGTTQGMPIGYEDNYDDMANEDSLMITKDFNFINIDFYLEYRITDPIAYTFSTSDPEGMLRNIALASIRNTVGLVDVDTALTTGKSQIEIDVREDIAAELEKHKTGLTISNVSIQDSEPPTEEVSEAFKAVNDAKTGKDTAINNASAAAKTVTENASAEAAKILSSAEATRTERINQASEEVARFNALYEEYTKNPEIVRERMYLDAVKAVYPNMEIVIGDGQVVYVTGQDSAAGTGAAVGTARAAANAAGETNEN
ncbi:MAG: FtsH protease activity modulator HflK [Lachnospiraceae bacterium]|nr:FtsH protease activity modulator HflK [Lachnospiraceae bacterium]